MLKMQGDVDRFSTDGRELIGAILTRNNCGGSCGKKRVTLMETYGAKVAYWE